MAGKAGRFVCIFVPMVLTMLALVFLVMIGLGQTNASNSYLSNLYFVRLNTTNVTANSNFAYNTANALTDPNDKNDDGNIIIQNFYTVGLWGYCAGAGDNTTRSILSFGQKTAQTVNFCSPRSLQYGFDPSSVWGLSTSTQTRLFGQDFSSFINDNYLMNNRRWISTLYILAVTSTSLQILIGIGGLFSRLGSVFTTIASFFTSAFIFAFAILSTITYGRMIQLSSGGLANLGITITGGPTMFAYMWCAWAASFIGGLFWAFSSCCCSGHRHEDKGKMNMSERTPYTYERMAEAPFGSTQTINAERVGGFDNGYRHGQ
jgi:hypothetical protein